MGRCLSVSGKMSCPEAGLEVQCLRYAARMSTQVIVSRSRITDTAKNGTFEPFTSKNDRYAKTSSGQTEGKLKKKVPFFAPRCFSRSPHACRHAKLTSASQSADLNSVPVTVLTPAATVETRIRRWP